MDTTNKTPEWLNNIDWTDLRTQKRLLLETINNDAVSPEHKEGLEGILNLLDAMQDYAVDELGVSEMLVFDFELEEEREFADDNSIIGFQVVNDSKGEIHPDMDASFCIYSLSQAKIMIADDPDYWKLLAIREGDIEEPTILFLGDPKK